MKVTMINEDYKRNLKNNQVIEKSHYTYDQVAKSGKKKEFAERFDSYKKNYISKINEIKSN